MSLAPIPTTPGLPGFPPPVARPAPSPTVPPPGRPPDTLALTSKAKADGAAPAAPVGGAAQGLLATGGWLGGLYEQMKQLMFPNKEKLSATEEKQLMTRIQEVIDEILRAIRQL